MAKRRNQPTPGEQAAIDRRRERLSELLLRGHRGLSDLARRLDCDAETVRRDLRALDKLWQERSVKNLTVLKEQELDHLAELQLACWEAWEASKQPAVVERAERVAGPTRVRETVRREKRHRIGDLAVMDLLLRIVEWRCKLLGLDSPHKVAPTSPDGSQAFGAPDPARLAWLESLPDEAVLEIAAVTEKYGFPHGYPGHQAGANGAGR